MPRLPIDKNPKLRRHAASGQGVVTLAGRDHYLGLWPAATREARAVVRAAYDRLIGEWRINGRRAAIPAVQQPGFTVGELILRFWAHVEKHYRHADGTPTSEVDDYRLSLRPLRRLYSTLPATEFSPLKLTTVRQTMIDADLSRGVINQRVGRIVRMFRWAVEEELVPETVYRALRTVPGRQRGRCEATETDPIQPVPDAWVDAARPFVLPPVRAMIDLQRLTGMRPGEVCAMCACDLDTAGQMLSLTYTPSAVPEPGTLGLVALGLLGVWRGCRAGPHHAGLDQV